MNKGQTAEETITRLKRLDKAGFTCATLYFLGMGGKGKGQESARTSAAIFNQVRPQRITSTAMTPFAKAPVARMVRDGGFVMPSEREMIEALRTFLAGLDIDTFYDGVHYLHRPQLPLPRWRPLAEAAGPGRHRHCPGDLF